MEDNTDKFKVLIEGLGVRNSDKCGYTFRIITFHYDKTRRSS